DRAARARRQPGSAFKPFVWAAALHPQDGGAPLFTAASMVDDAPITLQVGGKPWTPRNYDDRYEGRVSARRAIEQSPNSAPGGGPQAVAIPAGADMPRPRARHGDTPDVPAAALGSFEVTPVDLARAYLPFANGGVRPGAVRAVSAVYRADG